jgi:hypothetical protein
MNATEKLHAQAAAGKRRRGRSVSDESKNASTDSGTSDDAGDGVAHDAASRSHRRGLKQRGASAAAAAFFTSASRSHGKIELPQRGCYSGVRLGEAASELSEDDSSSDGDQAADESDSSGRSALSELSAAESDDNLELFIDELDVFEFDDDEAEEWQPPAAAAAAAAGRRAPNHVQLRLLKLSPLTAVQRFIVDELDVEAQAGPTRFIVQHLLEVLDARKSV